jgi:hypothetical protein
LKLTGINRIEIFPSMIVRVKINERNATCTRAATEWLAVLKRGYQQRQCDGREHLAKLLPRLYRLYPYEAQDGTRSCEYRTCNHVQQRQKHRAFEAVKRQEELILQDDSNIRYVPAYLNIGKV